MRGRYPGDWLSIGSGGRSGWGSPAVVRLGNVMTGTQLMKGDRTADQMTAIVPEGFDFTSGGPRALGSSALRPARAGRGVRISSRKLSTAIQWIYRTVGDGGHELCILPCVVAVYPECRLLTDISLGRLF